MDKEVLHIGVMEKGGTRVLKLTGELDSYTSDRLSTLSKTWVDGSEKVIVNLDGLEYIDSSGLAALVGLWVRVNEAGASMQLSCQNPRINRVLEITGLLGLFAPESENEPMVIHEIAVDMNPNRAPMQGLGSAKRRVAGIQPHRAAGGGYGSGG